MPLKIALRASGKKLTPYVQHFSSDGRVQQAFAEQIGESTGQCVRSNVNEGMNQQDIQDAVADCAKQHAGTSLNV